MEVLESGQGGVMCGRGCGGGGDDDDDDLSPCSPQPPHVVAEHSYSLCGDSRPQSPLSHLTGEQEGEEGETTEGPTHHGGVDYGWMVDGWMDGWMDDG